MNELDYQSAAIRFAILLVALTIHEAAHAWTSNKLGDPTARQLGRLSLNPIVHIDPIGTLLLPLLSLVSPVPLIGWAKPVPVDMRYLRHPYRDFGIIAAAGPISNFLQAAVGAAIWLTVYGEASSLGGWAVWQFIATNLMLAFFNLVPIPPLDGGNVLAALLPRPGAEIMMRMAPFGFIILYALMFTGILSQLITPPVFFFLRLLV